jgi:hypothetical protein
MEAINEFRRIKGTRERRKELERELRDIQEDFADEMGSFSHTVDLTDLARACVEQAETLSLGAALGYLASLSHSREPEALKAAALERLEETPLSAIFAQTKIDSSGKVVSRRAALSGPGEPTDDWYKYTISQAESLQRRVIIAGQFEPIRQYLVSRFSISDRHFQPITQQSPFVPPGYDHLFSLGFARLLQGDYPSAVYLLIPQLENSIRHVLKLRGHEPSMIQSDMTQEDRSLSALLESERPALAEIFGGPLIFEIDLLFNDRAGPALRHEIAHGKLSAGDAFGPDCVYAAWLIFRLTCIPLFDKWEEFVSPYLREEEY